MEDLTNNGEAEQRKSEVPPVAGVDGPSASAAVPSTDAVGSMTSCVTRHAPFTSPVEWRFLACGIDSLDLGLHVRWGETWEVLSAWLEEKKNLAAGSEGSPSGDGRFFILPTGKRPCYRWHLEFPEFHLYIGRSAEPHGDTPNVYVSAKSQALWQTSAEQAVALVVREIKSFGGKVIQVKPSRCDLAADFLIPGGLTREFLMALRVPLHVKNSSNSSGDRLETFYYGAKKSPIQLRIYDKGLEVWTQGTKLWFLDVWQLTDCEGVWRVEFQLRRKFLDESKIHSISDLMKALGRLWSYLTGEWFSLRLLDDTNTTRRTIHPWWRDVHGCAAKFGEVRPLVRNRDRQAASVDWFVSHIGGCFSGFAARLRLDNYDAAFQRLDRELRSYFATHSFRDSYTVKAIKLGHPGLPLKRPRITDSPAPDDEEAE